MAVQPNLILLDMDLPDVSGYDLCYTLKAIRDTRHIPVIFMTKCNELFDQSLARAAGGTGYLTKPFHFDDLYTSSSTLLPSLSAFLSTNQLNNITF
jgi:DNA-binding response OmpR family regulator